MQVEALFLEFLGKWGKMIHLRVQKGGKRTLVVLEPSPSADFGLILPGERDHAFSPCIDLACPLEQRKPDIWDL